MSLNVTSNIGVIGYKNSNNSNGKFVAVAGNGSNYFAYSSDGINWTEGTISDTSREWYSVCYGNGKFVAVAYDTYFAYSTDGINWTEGTISSTSRYWVSVCYGNGKFVAVVFDSNYFAYSTDGINWTEGTISSTKRYWYSVCYGNGKFVAIAGYNSNTFAYSTDGITWTEGTISDTSRNWIFVCYGNGKFVAVAGNGSNYFAYSSDGINWTESTISSTSRKWESVCSSFINASINTPDKAFNLSQPENASTTEFEDKVILDSIVHHDSPMYLLINRKAIDNNFYIHSPVLGDITLTGSDRKIYPVDSNMNRNCIGGKLHPLGNGYVAYSVYSNNMDATSKFSDSDTGSLELITGVIKANPYLGYYKSVNGQGFYGIENDEDEFMKPYRKVNDTNYSIEFSNNHTGISSDVTDVNGISSMTTYTEQYTEDVYYIHYAWVDRASSSLVRYNVLTRKIDTSSGTPVISNVTSYTTTFSIGTIAHPSFHKDKNGIHCAFYHGNTTYTKYYKLTRSGTDDSTWSWGVDSNTYITNENISLMVNKNENNLQSSLAQSARRMYMVNSSNNLVEFKKTQTF